jgi:hypothetical protein
MAAPIVNPFSCAVSGGTNHRFVVCRIDHASNPAYQRRAKTAAACVLANGSPLGVM